VKYFSNTTNNNTIEKKTTSQKLNPSMYLCAQLKAFRQQKKALSKVNKMINKYKAQKYSETPKRKGKI
jgi:hypothetical protein